MTFNSTTPGGPTVKATAWYLNGQRQRFKKPLSANIRPASESVTPERTALNPNIKPTTTSTTSSSCSSSVILSIPRPPNSQRHPTATWTCRTGSAVTQVQSMNLTNMTTSLTGLGFGSINNTNGTAVGTRDRKSDRRCAFRICQRDPLWAKIHRQQRLFQDRINDRIDGVSAVPEPSSVILLFTVAILGFKLSQIRAAAVAISPDNASNPGGGRLIRSPQASSSIPYFLP